MADNEEEIEVLDLSELRRNQSRYINQIFGDVTKQSAAKQVMIGGTAGCASGYLSVKVGKSAAIGIGATMLIIRIAQHQGYIQINWKRVNKEMDQAKRTLKKEVGKQYPQLTKSLQRFVQENMFLAGSFAGGFFLGLAF